MGDDFRGRSQSLPTKPKPLPKPKPSSLRAGVEGAGPGAGAIPEEQEDTVPTSASSSSRASIEEASSPSTAAPAAPAAPAASSSFLRSRASFSGEARPDIKPKPSLLPKPSGASPSPRASSAVPSPAPSPAPAPGPLPPPPPPPPPLPAALLDALVEESHTEEIGEGEEEEEVEQEEEEEEEPSGAAQGGFGFLAEIQQGIALRAAPPPEERPKGRFVGMASELELRLSRRRREDSQQVRARIGQDLSEQVESLATELRVLEREGFAEGLDKFEQLLFLRDRVAALMADLEDISEEALAGAFSWPTDFVDDVSTVAKSVSYTQQMRRELLEKCRKEANSHPQTILDEIKAFMNAVRVIDASAVTRIHLMGALDDLKADSVRVCKRSMRACMHRIQEQRGKCREVGLSAMDRDARATRVYTLCSDYIALAKTLASQWGAHELASDEDHVYAVTTMGELVRDHRRAIEVRMRTGQWDAPQTVALGKAQKPTPKEKEHSEALEQLRAAIAKRDTAVARLLDAWRALERPDTTTSQELYQLLLAAVTAGNMDALEAIRAECSHEVQTLSGTQRSALAAEAVKVRSVEAVRALPEPGPEYQSALHYAARKPDLPFMAVLIRAGADPLAKGPTEKTPLQLVALKEFAATPGTAASGEPQTSSSALPGANFAPYMNAPELSDIVFCLDDGTKVYGHRILFAAQSEFFRTLLQDMAWVEAKKSEVALRDVSSASMKYLVEYIYTGVCLFPRDNLHLGFDLLALASRFLLRPMQRQCEAVLGGKINVHVAVPLYHAAYDYSALDLLRACCHFILERYSEIEDPGHEALLHILEHVTGSYCTTRDIHGGAVLHRPAAEISK